MLAAGFPVLGICYGQQLIAQMLGGNVRRGDKGEYGLAILDLITDKSSGNHSQILEGVRDHQQIWMSHRDTVMAAPEGFQVLATTSTCAIAAIEDQTRRLYGVQFHPEVVHTAQGTRILENFVFGICGCEKTGIPDRARARRRPNPPCVGERYVFFFVTGGVDSTVAFTLCRRALAPSAYPAFTSTPA